ncbi:MAG TPA: PA0069 family radical SAM protein [Polyangiaceae bacterium]|nr:PA0069 family radical SAM protein [Polyangiaceae bacterium]
MLRPLTSSNPHNRWRAAEVEYEPGEAPAQPLELFADEAASVLSENHSPDIPYRYSVNPYRGCAHGCAYCYARPSHEYLGFGSGTDFERKLVVKHRAPELLQEAFERRSWAGDSIMFSGNTDCYQPLEAELGLTRRCLEVCVRYRNPVHLITKSTLIERDIELLQRLHREANVGVSISVTFWDNDVARAIEPYAPTPGRRIETIRRLSEAGIPVGVNVAPLIPGLSDRDMVPILEAAHAAGAVDSMTQLLRLPGSAAEVFVERVREHLPLRAEKIVKRVREMRDGKLNDPRFHTRMTGQGTYATTLLSVYEATLRRLDFRGFPEPRAGTFRRPNRSEQLTLFERAR